MQVIWLESNTLTNVEAKAKPSMNGMLEYYVGVGDGKDKRCWEYRLFMVREFPHKPITLDDRLKLTGNYELVSVKNLKDSMGNYMYKLKEVEINPNDKDLLLFWILPLGYTDIKTNFVGSFNIIGKGNRRKDREGKTFKSPCFIIELTGDAVLSWEGVDKNNIPIRQTIKYIWNEKRLEI